MRFRRSRIVCISAAVAAALYGGNGVRARSLTWDANGPSDPLGQDGGGTWNLTLQNWVDGDLITGTNTMWSNSPADSATFGNSTSAFVSTTTPNNIDLAVAIVAQDITLGTATDGSIYNIGDFSGGSLTVNGNITKVSGGGQSQFLLGSGPLELASGDHVIAMKDSPNDIPELAMNGAIDGPGGITVDNGPYEAWGTLALNVDNTYTGVTNINKGRIVITKSNALGSTSRGTVISNQGTLSIGGAGTTVTSGLNIAEPITIKRDTYTGGEFERYTYAVFSANGSGTHTFSGPFVVDSVDARVRAETSTIVISSNITEGPDVTPGTGVLTLDGDFAGFVTLTGDNTGISAGGIKLMGGELNVTNESNLGGATAPLTFAGSGTLHLVGGFLSNFGSHPINNSTFSGGFDVDNGQTFTVDQPLGDAVNAVGSIGKRGLGTLNLNSTINLRGGSTFWDSGTVNVNSSVTLASLHLRSPVVNVGTGGSVTMTAGYNSFGQDSTGTNGGPDIATVNLTGNGQLIQSSGDDFNISDNANTQGTINVHDTAVFTTGGITWLGKGTGAVGTINQDGGTVNINRSGDFALVLGDGRSSNGPTGHYNLSVGTLNVAGQMYVGEGATGIGVFNMTGGTVNVNNTFAVGREGGVGTFDISAGTINKTGSGNTYIDHQAGAGSSSMTIRGTGQLIVGSGGEFWVGRGGGTGLLTIQDNGQLTTNNWTVIGRNAGEGASTGTLIMSGNGKLTKASGSGNDFIIADGSGCVGTVTLSGSSGISVSAGNFRIANGSGSTATATLSDSSSISVNAGAGEFWVAQGGGTGTLNIQGGTVTGNNWIAIGRQGGSVGVLNLSSGSLIKQGTNFLAVGSGGTSATLNQTGGTLNSNGTYIGEASNGTANLSGGTANFTGQFHVGHNGGVFGTVNISDTANVTAPNVIFGNNSGTGGGTINLDGGMLTATSFANGSGSGAKVFNFNGGTLKAAADSATFMTGITANVKDGGAIIDSNGHNVIIAAGLVNNGTGGLTKNGSGTLTLTGVNTYAGATSVTGGTLQIAGNLTTSSAASVTGGATLQIASNGSRVLRTPSITADTGKIDISNNKIITANPVGSAMGGVYGGVSGLIQTGRNGGGWTGASGIITSQSAAATGNFTGIGVATAQQVKGLASPTDTAVFAGQTVTGTDTLAMYTYGGDANLDGKINVDDYGRIDFNVNLGVSGWFNGDFNYDGKINVDDYGIIDFNVGIQGAPFPTAGGGIAATAPLANLSGVSAVPEPAGLTIIALGAASLLVGERRRRHRHDGRAVN